MRVFDCGGGVRPATSSATEGTRPILRDPARREGSKSWLPQPASRFGHARQGLGTAGLGVGGDGEVGRVGVGVDLEIHPHAALPVARDAAKP